MSPPTYFQLRWESTGDQWWYASPIEQFHDVAWCRSEVARRLLTECEMEMGRSYLIGGGHGGWLLYTAASAGDAGFVQELLERDPLHVFGEGEYGVTDILYAAARSKSKEVFKMVLDFAEVRRRREGSGRGDTNWLSTCLIISVAIFQCKC